MRRKEIDLARGFTVFIMTAVHVVLIYSTIEVHHSWLGNILAFLAEGPGAPLFTTVMGISFAFSKRNDVESTMKKSFKLLVLAYLLNLLKFVVPFLAGSIPEQLLTDHGISTGNHAIIELLLVGDILQLAAISLMVLAFVYKLKRYWSWASGTAAIIIFISPLFWGIHTTNPFINYLFNLLWTNDATVFFPVFPWLAYPLTGLALAHYISTKPDCYKRIRNMGLILIVSGLFISSFNSVYHWGNFYKSGPWGMIYYSGFVMLWLYGCHLAVSYIPGNNFFKLLFWLSRNITLIYIVQWVTIFWLLKIFGYRHLQIATSLICIFSITSLVFILSYLIERYLIQHHKNELYETSNI